MDGFIDVHWIRHVHSGINDGLTKFTGYRDIETHRHQTGIFDFRTGINEKVYEIYRFKKKAFFLFSLRSETQQYGAVAVGSVCPVTALATCRPAPVVGPSAAAVLEAAVVAAAAALPGITAVAPGGVA
jgi:hypothetical protein